MSTVAMEATTEAAAAAAAAVAAVAEVALLAEEECGGKLLVLFEMMPRPSVSAGKRAHGHKPMHLLLLRMLMLLHRY